MITEAELDEDEINKAIDLIDKEQEALAVLENKEVAEVQPKKEITISDITQMAAESYNDVSKKSDEIYDAFYGVVATRQDRSDVSKQMLVESQRLKIESMQVMANLANAQARLINAQNKAASGNVGVFINSKDGSDVGINLSNLAD